MRGRCLHSRTIPKSRPSYSIKAGHVETKAVKTRLAAETPETKRLSKRYGTPVKIYRTAKGGRLEISFTTDEDLQRLLGELAD